MVDIGIEMALGGAGWDNHPMVRMSVFVADLADHRGWH